MSQSFYLPMYDFRTSLNSQVWDLSFKAEHVRDFLAAGYGLLHHLEASEDAVCEVSLTAFRFLVDIIGVRYSQVILFGRSLGSGPAIYLASRFPVGGLKLGLMVRPGRKNTVLIRSDQLIVQFLEVTTTGICSICIYLFGTRMISYVLVVSGCFSFFGPIPSAVRILVSPFLSIRAAVQSIGGYFLSMAFQERFNNGIAAAFEWRDVEKVHVSQIGVLMIKTKNGWFSSQICQNISDLLCVIGADLILHHPSSWRQIGYNMLGGP